MSAPDEITGVEIRSIVSEAGEGFCHVVVILGDHDNFVVGQLAPNDVRKMALDWLAAAEAAECDSIVYRLLRHKFNLDLPLVEAFVTDMRNQRETRPNHDGPG